MTFESKRKNRLTPKPGERVGFAELLGTAHRLADKTGKVILPHFRTSIGIDHKGGSLLDPVTEADISAERAIRAELATLYPDHGIIGEELGASGAGAEHCWIVDPIDGTRAFVMGQPLWGTLIGLLRDGEPLLGLMDQPFTGERFFSGETESYFRRGGEERKMRTRPCPRVEDALLGSSSPDLFVTEEDRERFGALETKVRLRRYGGDCYNYCLLAMGSIDLVAEAGLQNFDILPLIPIVERAGGVVTTWDGGDPKNGGHILASGDKRLHEKALKLLAR